MLKQLNTWGGQPLPLNASRWVPGQGVDAATTGSLYVRLRGATAAVDAACRSMGGTRLDAASPDVGADWVACREQELPWFAQRAADHCLWRLSVPQTAPELALQTLGVEGIAAPLVEWHGGLRWVQAPRSAGDALKAAARAVGGDALLFRAEAALPISGEPLFDPQNAAVQRIQQQLKAAFDPAGIFNPGRTHSAR